MGYNNSFCVKIRIPLMFKTMFESENMMLEMNISGKCIKII